MKKRTILFAALGAVAAAGAAVEINRRLEYFKCPECGQVFKPSVDEYYKSKPVFEQGEDGKVVYKRALLCPKCNEVLFCTKAQSLKVDKPTIAESIAEAYRAKYEVLKEGLEKNVGIKIEKEITEDGCFEKEEPTEDFKRVEEPKIEEIPEVISEKPKNGCCKKANYATIKEEEKVVGVPIEENTASEEPEKEE